MTADQYIKIGKWTLRSTLSLGIIAFGLFYFHRVQATFAIFNYYSVIALTVTLVVIMVVFTKGSADKENRKRLYTAGGLLILNFPIAFCGFIWVALILTGVMRITLTNSQSETLTDIHVTGCEHVHIDKLNPGQSKTVWINIQSDCSINVDYIWKGDRDDETIYGYTTPGMGKKIQHEI